MTRRVRVWGGPRDGRIYEIGESAHTLNIPETSRPMWEWIGEAEVDPVAAGPMPTFKVVSYKIMKSPVGWVAVHPSIDTSSLAS